MTIDVLLKMLHLGRIFEIVLRIKSRPGRTQLNIRRQQVYNNLSEVVSKALRTKLPSSLVRLLTNAC